ncbi:MAG: CatA-like O-acetyltransferase [Traorella sp.]
MSFKEIDLEHYPRREHFEYFSSLQYPYVGITNNVDVSELVHFCKEHQYSFYLVFMHAVALAADEIDELRQRIHNQKIIEYSECPTSHIELLDNGTYCYCTLYHHMELDEYVSYAENARKQCRLKGSIEEDSNSESMYFISTLPWLHYSSLIQPVAGGEESNPRITWGKYQKDYYGREQLPVTILVHHALVDGIHIAHFYENLEKHLQMIVSY